MTHARLLILPIAALLVAAAPAPTVPSNAEIDTTVQRISGHYSRDATNTADWARPLFTTAATKQIRIWQKHIGNNLTSLNDYGWFCECQDWDSSAFKARRTAVKALGPDRIEVSVSVLIGEGVTRRQRLVLVKEAGRWMIDDLFSSTVPKGMRADIRRELAIPKNRL